MTENKWHIQVKRMMMWNVPLIHEKRNNFIGSHVGSSSVFIAIFATEKQWKGPAGRSYLALI